MLYNRLSVTDVIVFVLFFVLTGCGGGGGSDASSPQTPTVSPAPPPSTSSPNTPTQTYSLLARVVDLSNSLTLAVKIGEITEIVAVDVANTLVFSQLDDGTRYEVIVQTQPEGEICSVENGKGQIKGADIKDIVITCQSIYQHNVRLHYFQQQVEQPSVVSSIFQVIDNKTNLPITSLPLDSFMVTENGQDIAANKLYLNNFDYVATQIYKTTLLLDISNNMSEAEFIGAKNAIKALINRYAQTTQVSAVETEQRLPQGHYLSIQVISDTHTLVLPFTQSRDALLTAIDGIVQTQQPLSLHTPLVSLLSESSNFFTLDTVELNQYVLVTKSVSSINAQELNALQEIQNDKPAASLYILDLNETAHTELSHLGQHQYYHVDELTNLTKSAEAVADQLMQLNRSLYYLYYASSQRSGTHQVQISVDDNQGCNTHLVDTVACVEQLVHSFSADGFSAVQPTLAMRVPSPMVRNKAYQLKALTRWANQSANHQWQIEQHTGEMSLSSMHAGQGHAEATLNIGNNRDVNHASLTVTDTNNPTATKLMHMISGSYVAAALSEYTLTLDTPLLHINIEDSPGNNPPEFIWKVANEEVAILSTDAGPQVSILGLRTGITYLYLTDIANDTSAVLILYVEYD
ncbi:vWA domain-containing protein [Flocculibacter collagenilyticus]|uniref:vWA domain-containing protein n=1 Tax=Flocculibacter collagenilyticus TaxID=2744479 RepID=UPI0018F2A527|nr:vWA domain-containing protein [Flocculibacter collagenilyticus]